jgi:hypothetical protein
MEKIILSPSATKAEETIVPSSAPKAETGKEIIWAVCPDGTVIAVSSHDELATVARAYRNSR